MQFCCPSHQKNGIFCFFAQFTTPSFFLDSYVICVSPSINVIATNLETEEENKANGNGQMQEKSAMGGIQFSLGSFVTLFKKAQQILSSINFFFFFLVHTWPILQRCLLVFSGTKRQNCFLKKIPRNFIQETQIFFQRLIFTFHVKK